DSPWYSEGDTSWLPYDDEPGEFDWSGDLGDGAQRLVDEITEIAEGDHFADFAVLIDDDTAATVADHVAKLAVDGDTLSLSRRADRRRSPAGSGGPHRRRGPVVPK